MEKKPDHAIQLDAIIPRQRACRLYLGVSEVTAWRRERTDPRWPPVIDMGGGRRGYRASAIADYLAQLPEVPTKRIPTAAAA